MHLLFLLFTGFSIGITGAIIPGPLMLFTVSETLKTNKFAGLKIISGHIVIELVTILLIFMGLQKLLTSNLFLFIVSIIGGLALISMGVLLYINFRKMKLSGIKSDTGFNMGLFVGGIVFSAISPGFILWWATIGISTLAKAALSGTTGILILVLGHWIADIVWYGTFSFAIDKGKTYLTDKTYQTILKTSSFLLIALGILFMLLN